MKPFLAVLNDFVTIELDAIGILSKIVLFIAHRTLASPDNPGRLRTALKKVKILLKAKIDLMNLLTYDPITMDPEKTYQDHIMFHFNPFLPKLPKPVPKPKD